MNEVRGTRNCWRFVNVDDCVPTVPSWYGLVHYVHIDGGFVFVPAATNNTRFLKLNSEISNGMVNHTPNSWDTHCKCFYSECRVCRWKALVPPFYHASIIEVMKAAGMIVWMQSRTNNFLPDTWFCKLSEALELCATCTVINSVQNTMTTQELGSLFVWYFERPWTEWDVQLASIRLIFHFDVRVNYSSQAVTFESILVWDGHIYLC